MVDKKPTPRHRTLALGRALTLALAAVASSVVAADERPSRLVKPLSPSQSATAENVNISTAEFWDAYTSEVVEERRRAQFFLIGVLDATEGVSWCDYRRFKTITIEEVLFEGLRKLPREQMKERAARTISQILAKGLVPCGRTK